MKNLTFNHLLLLLIASICVQCASSSRITGTWKSDEADLGSYQHVIVVALTEKTVTRQQVEDKIVQGLTEIGVHAQKSIDVFPPDFVSKNLSKSDVVLQEIKRKNADAIVTVALIDQTSEQRYVPSAGAYPVTRFGYYGNFARYYGNWANSLYAPGYYTTDKTYYIETNVYDVQSGNLVWSAQSETYNPAGIDGFLNSYTKAMKSTLEKEGLIKAK